MKKISLISFVLAVIFLFSSLGASKIQALTCQQSRTRIATIEQILPKEGDVQNLELKRVYTFDSARVGTVDKIKIDNYLDIVGEYVSDELDDFENFPEASSFVYDIFEIPTYFSDKIAFGSEDVIVSGPPLHICNYAFTGIFNSNGGIKYALIDGGFGSYSLFDNKIEVVAGKELECAGFSCRVKANFEISGKSFNLVSGQEHELKNSLVERIFLYSAQAPEGGINAVELFPWGGGQRVIYLLTFANQIEETENIEGESASTTEDLLIDDTEEPLEDLDADEETVEAEKRPNIFIRFFSWIKSFFK